MQGVLIAAHGSRSKDVAETMQFIMNKVRERLPKVKMQLGYLGGTPSIEEALDALRIEEVDQVIMIPYFLFRGIHVKETLPEIAEAYRKAFPDMHIEIGAALGEDERLAAVLAERIQETGIF